MKRACVLVALLLAAPASFPQGLPPFELDGVLALPGAQKIRFTVDDGGRRRRPAKPPNLTREQVQRVATIMNGGGGASGVDRALVYRVVNVMAKTDIESGEPIPAEEWDRRIAAFEAGFNAAFPPGSSPSPAELERGVDVLLRRMIARADDPYTQYLDRGDWKSLHEELRAGDARSPNSFSRMAAPGVGYVYFAAFAENVDREVFGHIDRLRAAGAMSLVLDLRGNPGGYDDMAQSIASEFLRDGQAIGTKRAQGLVLERSAADGDGRYKDLPLAVIIDADSASASEVLAAVLQDHARATVVGRQSYGKGTFQAVVPTEIPVERRGAVIGRVPDGTGARVTGGGWFPPSGRSVQGRLDTATGRNVPGTGGVRPDVTVSVSDSEQAAVMEGLAGQLRRTGPAAAYDPALGAAVRVLSR